VLMSGMRSSSIESTRQASMILRASAKSTNQFWFMHSSRNFPLKLSMNPFCIGLPGSTKCSHTPLTKAHWSTARLMNSGPLSP
jgi:hypothetical protein